MTDEIVEVVFRKRRRKETIIVSFFYGIFCTVLVFFHGNQSNLRFSFTHIAVWPARVADKVVEVVLCERRRK